MSVDVSRVVAMSRGYQVELVTVKSGKMRVSQVSKQVHTLAVLAFMQCARKCQETNRPVRNTLLIQFVPNGTLDEENQVKMSWEGADGEEEIGTELGEVKKFAFRVCATAVMVDSNKAKLLNAPVKERLVCAGVKANVLQVQGDGDCLLHAIKANQTLDGDLEAETVELRNKLAKADLSEWDEDTRNFYEKSSLASRLLYKLNTKQQITEEDIAALNEAFPEEREIWESAKTGQDKTGIMEKFTKKLKYFCLENEDRESFWEEVFQDTYEQKMYWFHFLFRSFKDHITPTVLECQFMAEDLKALGELVQSFPEAERNTYARQVQEWQKAWAEVASDEDERPVETLDQIAQFFNEIGQKMHNKQLSLTPQNAEKFRVQHSAFTIYMNKWGRYKHLTCANNPMLVLSGYAPKEEITHFLEARKFDAQKAAKKELQTFLDPLALWQACIQHKKNIILFTESARDLHAQSSHHRQEMPSRTMTCIPIIGASGENNETWYFVQSGEHYNCLDREQGKALMRAHLGSKKTQPQDRQRVTIEEIPRRK